MNVKLFVLPSLLVFAVCLALGGQVRAVDDAGSDSDDVGFSADDLVFTAAARVSLEPPAVSDRELPLPGEIDPGRLVIADLFRPPIAASSGSPR